MLDVFVINISSHDFAFRVDRANLRGGRVGHVNLNRKDVFAQDKAVIDPINSCTIPQSCRRC